MTATAIPVPVMMNTQHESSMTKIDGRSRRPAVATPRKRMLRIKEASEYCGFSAWKMRQEVHLGKIPYSQDGEGPMYIDIRDLDSYLDRRRKKASPHGG